MSSKSNIFFLWTYLKFFLLQIVKIETLHAMNAFKTSGIISVQQLWCSINVRSYHIILVTQYSKPGNLLTNIVQVFSISFISITCISPLPLNHIVHQQLTKSFIKKIEKCRKQQQGTSWRSHHHNILPPSSENPFSRLFSYYSSSSLSPYSIAPITATSSAYKFSIITPQTRQYG